MKFEQFIKAIWLKKPKSPSAANMAMNGPAWALQLPALQNNISFREDVVVIVAALALASGTLLGGFDSFVGQSLSGVLAGLIVALVVIAIPPTMAFWRRTAPVLACSAAAYSWVVLAHYLPSSSIVPAQTLTPDLAAPEMIAYWSGLAALIVGALISRNHHHVNLALMTLIFINSAALLFSIVAQQGLMDGLIDSWSMARQGRLMGTIGNANVTATIAATTGLLATHMLLKRITAPTIATLPFIFALGAALFVSVIALISTASRFANLIFVLSAATLIWLTFRQCHQQRGLRICMAVLTALFGIAWWLTPNGGLVSERFELLNIESGDRMLLWQHYLGLAWAEPLYGYGFGAFSTLNMASLTNLEIAQALWSVNSPHNIGIQLLITGGLPYLLLLVGAAAWLVFDLVRINDWLKPGPMQVAIGLAVVIFIAMGCIDIALDYPVSIYQMLFLAGLLWTPDAPHRMKDSSYRLAAGNFRTVRP